MDLQFSAEDRAFADELRQWLTHRLDGEFAAVRGQGAPGREYEAVDARIAWSASSDVPGSSAWRGRRRSAGST